MKTKIIFHGAAGDVTGSCTQIISEKNNFLVDCGLFQGAAFIEDKNFAGFKFEPKKINFVLLTHAHIDHCGRLPLLFKSGFIGPIYCTAPTKELVKIILLDAAEINERESRQMRVPPLFRPKDIDEIYKNLKIIKYDRLVKINKDISFIAKDAGHILGSCSYKILIKENDKQKSVIFSGDVGNVPAPIVKDTEYFDGSDSLVIEATYGGRIHEPSIWRHKLLKQAIDYVQKTKGTLLIPAFALERTQEVLYALNHLVEEGFVKPLPIFIDSPLAIEATKIYRDFAKDFFDTEALAKLKTDDDLFSFPGLKIISSLQESKNIIRSRGPKVIIAGNGMLSGGRMPYHLQSYLPDSNSLLLIISYQPENSLGRQLIEGRKQVKIMNKVVKVKAKVRAIGAFSSHADQPQLLHFAKQLTKPTPKNIFINHSEEKSALALAEGLKQKLNLNSNLAEQQKETNLFK
jgi:metallo-beta-lactamase family protein